MCALSVQSSSKPRELATCRVLCLFKVQGGNNSPRHLARTFYFNISYFKIDVKIQSLARDAAVLL